MYDSQILFFITWFAAIKELRSDIIFGPVIVRDCLLILKKPNEVVQEKCHLKRNDRNSTKRVTVFGRSI